MAEPISYDDFLAVDIRTDKHSFRDQSPVEFPECSRSRDVGACLIELSLLSQKVRQATVQGGPGNRVRRVFSKGGAKERLGAAIITQRAQDRAQRVLRSALVLRLTRAAPFGKSPLQPLFGLSISPLHVKQDSEIVC